MDPDYRTLETVHEHSFNAEDFSKMHKYKNKAGLEPGTKQGCTQPRGREQGKTQTINIHQVMREEEIGGSTT